MMSLPSSFGLAMSQLGDPRILRVLAKSILITLTVFILLGIGGYHALTALLAGWGVNGSSSIGALAALLLTIIGGWLLFRLVALAVLQFFADEVVLAVEQRHYPEHARTARTIGFAAEFANSARATLRAVLVNLAVLPFALVLLATGIGTAILFLCVNGWLLGRELQDMVWLRHRRDKSETAPVSAFTRFLLGLTVAGLLAVPFANLLAPILGAAAATHLVHRRKKVPDA